MPLMSAIVTCKGRLEHLKQTLPLLMAMPDSEVIVVDYDCPEHSGDWVRAEHPDAIVVEAGDRPAFNNAEARNIGAGAATSPWLLFIDADVIVAPDALARTPIGLTADTFVLFEPRKTSLSGTVIVSREAYDAIGGYDEAFEGWGTEDRDFVERLWAKPYRSQAFAPNVVRSIEHGDDLRTQFHKVKDLDAISALNIFYLTVKADLARQGAEMDLATRKAVYAELRSRLAMGVATTINLPYKQLLVGGRVATAVMRYDIAAPPS